MKNTAGLIVGSLLLFSSPSIAKPDDFVKKTGDQFYVGADLTAANNVDVSINGESADRARLRSPLPRKD